jgi:hypothetical protein
MKQNDLDNLANEVLRASDNFEACRQASLEAGLAALSRRRRQRRFGAACAVACLVAFGVVVIHSLHESLGRNSGAIARAPFFSVSRPPDQDGVKVIGDEELFALFPDRPIALIGKPGHQQLVFFDRPTQAIETLRR